MRRIKVTFDLGGTWRLVTTIQVSKAITITAAKKVAIQAAKERLAELNCGVGFGDVQAVFAEVLQ